MTKRDRAKIIFSWISLECGILSLLLNMTFEMPALFFSFPVSIIAIYSGVYGLWGKTIKVVKILSCIGVILGHLCYGLFWPTWLFLLD
ncbi:MAG: hypothetical protein U9O59_05245 [Actinomycetota bacterium]|nr:hypothetical protein [Actinomycetota bacterium]